MDIVEPIPVWREGNGQWRVGRVADGRWGFVRRGFGWDLFTIADSEELQVNKAKVLSLSGKLSVFTWLRRAGPAAASMGRFLANLQSGRIPTKRSLVAPNKFGLNRIRFP